MQKRREANGTGIERCRENYKHKKEYLTKVILKSKERCWKTLVEDLNNDIWGDALRIACKKFQSSQVVTYQKSVLLKRLKNSSRKTRELCGMRLRWTRYPFGALKN